MPEAIIETRNLRKSLHHIADVEQVADHVVIIDRGRAIVAAALEDLREQYRRILFVFDDNAPAAAFRASGVERVYRDDTC